MTKQLHHITVVLAASALLALTGCGGGGGGPANSSATLTGTLIDASTNLPATGTQVTLYTGSTLVSTTTTNSSGVFTFTTIPAGEHGLIFADGSTEIGTDSVVVAVPETSMGDIRLRFEGNPPPPPPSQGASAISTHG